jgi:hypothetical protein
MGSARDLLERFRPAGTPGAAAPAGVPYDRSAALEDELRPVLDLLAPTEQQCVAVLDEAGARADALRDDAAARAAASLSQARLRAEEARADAAESRRRISDEEGAAELERATRAAAEVGALARRRLPGLTARVVAAVREQLTAPSEPERG